MTTLHLADAHFTLPPSIEALEQLISRLKTRFEDLTRGWLMVFHGIDQGYAPDFRRLVVSFSVFPSPQAREKLSTIQCWFYAKGLQVGYNDEHFKPVEVDTAIRNLLQALQETREAVQ